MNKTAVLSPAQEQSGHFLMCLFRLKIYYGGLKRSSTAVNIRVTLPVGWELSPTTFSCMPVITARWLRENNAASRHWLLFLRASTTIDVISDSQPWIRGKKKEKKKKFIFNSSQHKQTGGIKIDLLLNWCKPTRRSATSEGSVNKLKWWKNIKNQDWEVKIACLGAKTWKEFRFCFHIFMFCVGLKVENSLSLTDRPQTAQS